MKTKHISALTQVVSLKYQHQQKAFQKIVATENALRAEYRRLDSSSKKVFEQTDSSMQGIGADVMWQAWLERSKVRVNRELAQVLVQKEHYLQRVRTDFGKVEVVKALEKTALSDEKKARNDKKLNEAIASMLNSK